MLEVHLFGMGEHVTIVNEGNNIKANILSVYKTMNYEWRYMSLYSNRGTHAHTYIDVDEVILSFWVLQKD